MCKHINEIINETFNILERHIDEHMFYTNKNRQDASQDFFDKYYFIVRESYCDKCEDNSTCIEYQDYLKYNEWNEIPKDLNSNNTVK